MYLGDFAAADVIDFKFTTRRFSTGAPFTLAGTPAVSVYKSNSTTESTTGVTLTVDFDARTGLNHVRIDTSLDGTFYADGSQFDVVITVGTVDSVSVVGERIGRFTLRAQAALYPTTAGRRLDVSAGGEAGLDWANIGSPTTVQGLSGTTVKTATDVETDTVDIQARLPAALVSGRIDSNVGAMAANSVTASAIADGAIDRGTFAADTGLQSIRSATAQAGAATTITLDASASATTDFYKGCLIYITGSTGVGQYRLCTAYNGTTKVATITPAWATNPSATSTFAVLPVGMVDVESYVFTTQTARDLGGQLDAAVSTRSVAGDSMALTAAAVDAVLDDVVEGSFTLRQLVRGFASALLGKASGLAGTTAVFRDTGDTKNRISATVDSSGNRSAVTLDLT